MKTDQIKWYYWLMLILVSGIFLAGGIAAFAGNADEWKVFEKAGYSTSFYHLIALLEILGGIGLWITRLRILAAIGLIVIMVGALVTQVINKDYLHCFGPIFFAVLLWLLIRQWKKLRSNLKY